MESKWNPLTCYWHFNSMALINAEIDANVWDSRSIAFTHALAHGKC